MDLGQLFLSQRPCFSRARWHEKQMPARLATGSFEGCRGWGHVMIKPLRYQNWTVVFTMFIPFYPSLLNRNGPQKLDGSNMFQSYHLVAPSGTGSSQTMATKLQAYGTEMLTLRITVKIRGTWLDLLTLCQNGHRTAHFWSKMSPNLCPKRKHT